MRTSLLSVVLLSAACTEYDLHPGADVSGFDSAPMIDSAEPEPEPEPESDLPVAVCDVTPNPVTPPFEEATWLGEDSYDPNGLSITDYEWTLVSSPSGSAVMMPNGIENRLGFIPDLAGDYVAELVVVNENGDRSEPCEVTLESIPAQNLWVEMFWTHAGDDMDLHLLAPGGTFNNNSTDCYYSNCTGRGLDWGVRNDVADDPTLDLDDIDRVGPENINITEPEMGTYTVVVHDYPGSSYMSQNDTTVRIYLNGEMVYEETRAIMGEDTKNYIAEINWATGEVTGL